MNETSVTTGRFARLQAAFAIKSLLITLPLIFAYFIFWQYFTGIVHFFSSHPDAVLMSSADRTHILFRIYDWAWWLYLVTLPASLFGMFCVWLVAVIRKSTVSDRMKSTARGLTIVAFLSTGVYWFCSSLLLQFLAGGLSAASDFHAEIAANAGVLPARGSSTDIGISRTTKVVDRSVVKGRYDRLLFLFRTIESEATSPPLARHYVGTLMEILKAAQEGTPSTAQWDMKELEMQNAVVQRIGFLASRTFPPPQESWGKYETKINGQVVAEGHVMKSESQKSCRTALLEWWTTVADKPEWEPVPLYEFDYGDTAVPAP